MAVISLKRDTDPAEYYGANIAREKSFLRVYVAWRVEPGELYQDTVLSKVSPGTPQFLKAPRHGYEVMAYNPDGQTDSAFLRTRDFEEKMTPAGQAEPALARYDLPAHGRITPVAKAAVFTLTSVSGASFRSQAYHPGVILDMGPERWFMDDYRLSSTFNLKQDRDHRNTFRIAARKGANLVRGIVLEEGRDFVIRGRLQRVAAGSFLMRDPRGGERSIICAHPDYTRYGLREKPGLKLVKR
jgi:hypothetical protein